MTLLTIWLQVIVAYRLVAITRTIILTPSHFTQVWSYRNTFEVRVLIDEIHRHTILKWDAVRDWITMIKHQFCGRSKWPPGDIPSYWSMSHACDIDQYDGTNSQVVDDLRWHGRHGISNHQQLDCLFHSFSGLTNKTAKLCVADQLWGESTCDQQIPLTKGQ